MKVPCNISHYVRYRSSQLDAGLLVNAMTKTSAFEVLLSKRFTGVTLRTTGEDKRLGSEDTSNEGTIPGLATAGGDSEAGTSPLNNRASFIDRNPFNVSTAEALFVRCGY